MKELFKSTRFKLIAAIIALLLAGALICAANGSGETAQSSIIAPYHPANWVATKISNGITYVFGEARQRGYLKRIDYLEQRLARCRTTFDYENLQKQTRFIRTRLGLKRKTPITPR
jgi:hypothetical protein